MPFTVERAEFSIVIFWPSAIEKIFSHSQGNIFALWCFKK